MHQFPERLPFLYHCRKLTLPNNSVIDIFAYFRYLDENYLSSGRKSEGWTLEEGYPADAEKDTYPRRAMSAGTRAGLVILMRAYQQDLDYICRGPVQGFKVLF